MSNDQMRHNQGKLPYSYWYQTRLSLYEQQTYILPASKGVVPVPEIVAHRLITKITSWLIGQIDHRTATAEWRTAEYYLDLPFATGYVEVCVFGEGKYLRGNFRKGQYVCHYADSLLRHLRKIVFENELVDTESGKSHFCHAFWNWVQIFEIMEQPEVRALRDDRLLHSGNLSGGQVPLAPPALPAKP